MYQRVAKEQALYHRVIKERALYQSHQGTCAVPVMCPLYAVKRPPRVSFESRTLKLSLINPRETISSKASEMLPQMPPRYIRVVKEQKKELEERLGFTHWN